MPTIYDSKVDGFSNSPFFWRQNITGALVQETPGRERMYILAAPEGRGQFLVLTAMGQDPQLHLQWSVEGGIRGNVGQPFLEAQCYYRRDDLPESNPQTEGSTLALPERPP